MSSHATHSIFSDHSGFTLIEVIVSMILVSMITLIMAFALKINLEAWERGNSEGDKVQISIVLPKMLEHQLRYIISGAQLASGDSLSIESANSKKQLESKTSQTGNASQPQSGVLTQLPFTGQDNILSFYTLYSPQGSPSKGLIRVSYIYDEDAKELTVYENVIASQDDIKDSDNLTSNSGKKRNQRSFGKVRKSDKRSGRKYDNDNLPVATIKDVEKFSLSFISGDDSTSFQGDHSLKNSSSSFGSSASRKFSTNRSSSSRSGSGFTMGGESFQDSWDENFPNPPGFIRLLFAQTKLRGGADSVWLFRVGGTI